ncbi:hypothetical protein H7169_02965 [Candidatus Gracilibacteria bacterium]|nr:hypothetical protein [Candidatus Gracilibacteria bacterium]
MRARFFSLVILILLVAVPIGAYYYFTNSQIASISISTGSGVVFVAQLSGSFELDGLPLADKALTYTQTCSGSCTISPILPAKYSLTLTASGMTTIADTFSIDTGEKIVRSYLFTDTMVFRSMGSIARDDTFALSLIDNARVTKIGEYTLIATDIQGRVWVSNKKDTIVQVGILSNERFVPIRNISTPIVRTTMDITRSVVIINLASSQTLFIPTDLSGEKEILIIPDRPIISVVPGTPWKILTSSGSYELSGERLIEDIRFSDSIDISPQIRLGYIDKKDSAKLTLANLPLGQSLLIRLDRRTGESIIVDSGIDMVTFFRYRDRPSYIDSSGNVHSIESR